MSSMAVLSLLWETSTGSSSPIDTRRSWSSFSILEGSLLLETWCSRCRKATSSRRLAVSLRTWTTSRAQFFCSRTHREQGTFLSHFTFLLVHSVQVSSISSSHHRTMGGIPMQARGGRCECLTLAADKADMAHLIPANAVAYYLQANPDSVSVWEVERSTLSWRQFPLMKSTLEIT